MCSRERRALRSWPGWAPTWSNWRLPAGTSRASRCVTSPTSTASTSRCSGCPIKLSDSPVDVHRSPLLGETNEDINGRELGRDDQLASLKAKGSSDESPQQQTEQAKGCRERNITRMTSPAQPRFREVVGSDGRVVPDRGDRPRHPGAFTGVDGMAAVGRRDGGQCLRVRLRLRREVPTGGPRREPVPDVLVAFHSGGRWH